jgi:predicted transglutaminase-like cysteine proteinase
MGFANAFSRINKANSQLSQILSIIFNGRKIGREKGGPTKIRRGHPMLTNSGLSAHASIVDKRPRNKTIALCCAIMLALTAPAAAVERALYASVGEVTRTPVGWTQFCQDNPNDCRANTTQPRDIIMSQTAWRDLTRINRYVNQTIKPLTDMDHWGVLEKWSYPTDGYGDCEEYALQKRKLLIEAGWPREALLITVVRDQNDEGHAVLMVKSDKGEFVLDNENERIVPWTETGYRFVKRQSQSNPNVWVSLGDESTAAATASSH